MSKSQVIKDLVNDVVSLDISLTRLKVILYNLNKPELSSWVDNELSGYNDENAKIPLYREIESEPYVKIIYIDSDGEKKYEINNEENIIRGLSIPINILEQAFLNKSKEHHAFFIPLNIIEKFYKFTRDVKIVQAYYDFGEVYSLSCKILPIVKQRSLDILLMLENEFGNLDDYDIDIHSKTDSEIEKIARRIEEKIGGFISMNLTINNNGGNNLTNLAGGNITINATQNYSVDVETLKSLISEVRSAIPQNMSDEDKQAVNDNLKIIEDEMISVTPNKDKVHKAWKLLSGFISLTASLVTLGQFLVPYVPAIYDLIATYRG